MTASRLLSTLLLLQTRQKMTVGEIASRLEVSARTVRRDVEALSAAGVPVYSERGRRGGIALLPGARIDVSRLDPPEVEALSLAGIDADQRRQLGVEESHRMATRKLDARHTRSDQIGLRELVLVDNSGWFSGDDQDARVSDLALDLRSGRRLSLSYRRSGDPAAAQRDVDPYGLVAKAGRWYLVADVGGEPALFLLARVTSWTVLDTRATRRDGCTLASLWDQLKASTERAGGVEITARIRSSRLDLASRILGSRMVIASQTTAEWTHITLSYNDIQGVRQLMQFGDYIEVIGPPAARAIVATLAGDLARRHGRSEGD
ncbi:MAG: WYL domain-containing protein [Rhodococcus sp. (in: high G+C Gram-positive bacteria)]